MDLNCLIRLSFYIWTFSSVARWLAVPKEWKCEVCNSKYFVPILGRSEDRRIVLEKTRWGGFRRIWETFIAAVTTNEVKMVRFILFLVFFMILLSCPEWFRPGFATRYKIFLNITHQPALREARPNMALFFFKVGLRKFIVARELFVPRPYFQRHLTDNTHAELSWLPLQIISCLGCGKSQSKYKVWVELV